MLNKKMAQLNYAIVRVSSLCKGQFVGEDNGNGV